MTTNFDSDKFKYSGYGIGFDASGRFSFYDGSEFGKNVMFSADINLSVNVDKKKKKIYLDSWYKSIARVRWYYIESKERMICKFHWAEEKIYLSLHSNGENSYAFIHGVEIYFQSKVFWNNAFSFCLGSISKDLSVDYNTISLTDILDIHKYLVVNNNIK